MVSHGPRRTAPIQPTALLLALAIGCWMLGVGAASHAHPGADRAGIEAGTCAACVASAAQAAVPPARSLPHGALALEPAVVLETAARGRELPQLGAPRAPPAAPSDC